MVSRSSRPRHFLAVHRANLFDRHYTDNRDLAGDAAFGYLVDPVRINEPVRMPWTTFGMNFRAVSAHPAVVHASTARLVGASTRPHHGVPLQVTGVLLQAAGSSLSLSASACSAASMESSLAVLR